MGRESGANIEWAAQPIYHLGRPAKTHPSPSIYIRRLTNAHNSFTIRVGAVAPLHLPFFPPDPTPRRRSRVFHTSSPPPSSSVCKGRSQISPFISSSLFPRGNDDCQPSPIHRCIGEGSSPPMQTHVRSGGSFSRG